MKIIRRVVVFDASDIAVRPDDNPDGDEFFAVYASPAGHPFCFCVG